MNYTFNINRFGKLIRQQYQLSGKTMGLAILSIFVVYTLILMTFTFNEPRIRSDEWIPFFITFTLAIAFPFAAYAFPAFRSKEKTFDYLLTPCSITEKFSFNVLIRIFIPWLVLPIVFYISSRMASELALWRYPDYNIENFNLSVIFDQLPDKHLGLIITSSVLMILITQSVLFSGATIFKKHPLIKTLVTLGATAAVIFFYFYIIIEWFGIYDNGRVPWLANFNNEVSAGYFLVALELLVLTTTWAYAFFKVKEKEIA